MVTVNFSVPDEVKHAFNKAFKQRNKSALIAELMREAVARQERLEIRRAALRRIAARQSGRKPASVRTIRSAREKGRV